MIITALATLAIACSEPRPTPTPTPTSASWGPYGTLRVLTEIPVRGHADLTVHEIRDPAPPSPLLPPLRPWKRYIGVDVTLEIVQDAKLDDRFNNPRLFPFFRVESSNSGKIFDPIEIHEPGFFVFRRMQLGEKERGWVIFEVDSGAKAFSFYYWAADDVLEELFKWER